MFGHQFMPHQQTHHCGVPFLVLMPVYKIFLFKCLTQQPIKIFPMHLLWEAIKVHSPVQSFKAHMTSLLSPLIIWMAEMLFLMRKKTCFQFLVVFQDSTYSLVSETAKISNFNLKIHYLAT